jgi:hypothetical protein
LDLEPKSTFLKAISQNRLAIGILILVSILSTFILIKFNGTGEEADSYHHFLISHYSIKHPYLFFDHWGKPLYTLLSAPFAQMGINGSKVFNVICSLLASWFAFKLSKSFKMEQAAWVILFIFLIPLNFQVNFSAFTEPLFAMMLMLGIWLMMQKKSNLSLLLISFLPMIRSEGLIILGVFGVYLIFQKQFRKLPLLLFGQLFYGFWAWLYLGKSPLWTFNEIPYAEMSSPYGSGAFYHFAEKLYYMCGLPLLILFLIGLISSLVRIKNRSAEWNILILGSFFAFFVFHSLAWSLGWFNSMGLKRVFGAVTPLMGIIMLSGLNLTFTYLRSPIVKSGLSLSWVLISAAFLFTNGPAAVNWKAEMNLSPSQELAKQLGEYIQEEDIPYQRLIYADRFLHYALKNDLYNESEFKLLNEEALSDLRNGDLVIWDNWHAPTDFGIQLAMLNNNPQLEKLESFEIESNGRTVAFLIFKKQD